MIIGGIYKTLLKSIYGRFRYIEDITYKKYK